MANLDLTYYKGTDSYSDGDASENYLLNMTSSGQTLDDIPAEDCTWPVFYHMSPVRENICNWYPFKKGASILEIGAGCGAITGVLCEKAARVTAVELSYRRATINYQRHKDCANLTIMVGNMNDMVMEQKYDYITLIGVLEYAGRFTEGDAPFHAFLNSFKRYLKPDGVLLIAIENRLGLKYFCGAAEDHTGRIYEGINKYPHYDGVRTFSKQELSELLEECGFSDYRFYYPYPDYKFPNEIFTQASLDRDKIPYITYDQDRISLFHEADMFNQLSKERVFDCFANSFFVEASSSEISHSRELVYCKLNQNRSPQFRIGTYIYQTECGIEVEKIALHPTAQDHIRKICEFSKQSYGTIPGLEVTPIPNGLTYPYDSSETLEDVIQRMAVKNPIEAVSTVNRYLEQLTADAALMCYDSSNFTRWFGAERLEELVVSCVPRCNVDAALSNVLCTGSGFRIIDCEWVTDFPVPAGFLYWRVIFALLVHIPELKRFINMEEWLLSLRISLDWIPVFESWENHFQTEFVNPGNQGHGRCNTFTTLECIQQQQSQAIMDIVSSKEEEILQLKNRVAYLENRIDSGVQTVGKLATYRAYKLVHLEKRIKHQLISKDRSKRKAFWKWLRGKLQGIACSDQSYNPLYEVVDALYGPGNNLGRAIPYSDDNFWGSSGRIDIMTPGHTLYIAKQIANNLRRVGYTCNIHDEQFCEFEDIPYIVICAQIMKALPQRYICYQLEQTINSRWLTENYFTIMRNASAIWDYSLVNIAYFSHYPDLKKKLFYIPLGITEESLPHCLPGEEQDCDILFYGDIHCERREKILDELKKEFSIRIESNLFGDDMLNTIRKAKIVINIHYYQDALLETTRIAEILSLGTSIIVSEKSNDPDEESRMAPLVDFVEIGDVDAMKRQLHWWLDHPEERRRKLEDNQIKLMTQLGDANFYFYRFMLASGQLEFDRFYDLTQQFISVPQNLRWCLHVPEQIDRKEAFSKENCFQFSIFPGLRYPIGWVGCAMSYKYMFRKLRDQGAEYATICEDDVSFPSEFAERFANVKNYLSALPQWDIMSGFMADISDDVTVTRMDKVADDTILTINKMISMVFNVYNLRAITIGSEWDEKNHHTSNTIDRYFESFDMRVVLDFPFLVEHKEYLQSTLWGKNNQELYGELLTKTIHKIENLIERYEQTQGQ